MADKNPYSDLFSFEDKKGSNAPAPASSSQKEKDVDAAAIIQKEFEKLVTRLAELRGKAPSTKPEDAAALQAEILRTEADIASTQRELKRLGVEVSAPFSGSTATSANPYKDLFTGMGDTSVPAKNEIDPFLGLSGAAGAIAGGFLGAKTKPAPSENSLAARLMERYYGLPSGALNTFEGAMPTPANDASLIAARTIAPPPAAASPQT
jgi:hypothetical protein